MRRPPVVRHGDVARGSMRRWPLQRHRATPGDGEAELSGAALRPSRGPSKPRHRGASTSQLPALPRPASAAVGTARDRYRTSPHDRQHAVHVEREVGVLGPGSPAGCRPLVRPDPELEWSRPPRRGHRTRSAGSRSATGPPQQREPSPSHASGGKLPAPGRGRHCGLRMTGATYGGNVRPVPANQQTRPGGRHGRGVRRPRAP